MDTTAGGRLRGATAADGPGLVALWSLLFDEHDAPSAAPWTELALDWFVRAVADPRRARIPVVEVGSEVVACAIGTLDVGVPNPHCPSGRGVRLANVVTRPEYRGRGYATALVGDVVDWARRIGADRVDLSATVQAQHLYARLGFTPTSAPRMKLVL